MSVMPETIVENCPQQISKVKGGFIMQISKEMLIGELLQVDENMAQILMGAECTASDARLLRWSLWKRLAWFTEFR